MLFEESNGPQGMDIWLSKELFLLSVKEVAIQPFIGLSKAFIHPVLSKWPCRLEKHNPSLG